MIVSCMDIRLAAFIILVDWLFNPSIRSINAVIMIVDDEEISCDGVKVDAVLPTNAGVILGVILIADNCVESRLVSYGDDMKPLQPTNWTPEDNRMEDINALMISISYLMKWS